jgi:hypothetical protein
MSWRETRRARREEHRRLVAAQTPAERRKNWFAIAIEAILDLLTGF